MNQKKGVIDIGSNSVRLLVADFFNDRMEVNFRALKVTGLGKNFSGDNYLLPASVKRTMAVIREFVLMAKERGVSSVTVIATSAVREARNRDNFIREVLNITGSKVRILSGEEEAYLSFRGAALSLGIDRQKIVLFDLGGGSTEFVWTEKEGKLHLRSFSLGVVKLKEMYDLDEKVCAKNTEEAKQYLNGIFTGIPVLENEASLVAVGGTATTLSAVNLGLGEYDPRKIHGSILSREQIINLQEYLMNTPPDARRTIPGLMPQRADVIVAGALIVNYIMDKTGARLLQISEGDLMIGLLAEEGRKVVI